MTAEISYSELPGLLASRPVEEAARIIALAAKQFDAPYYRARGDLIRALALVGVGERRSEVIALLLTGLEKALWRGEKRSDGGPGLDANFIGVSAAAVALGLLDVSEAGAALAAAFGAVSNEGAHHELGQCAGVLAIAAAMAAEPTAVASALVRCDKTWGEKESFVNQLRYARWVQERDGAGALAWLATPKPGAAYAAAALADLRAIEWVPELQRWCEQFEGPKRAALEHALSLLAEPPGERMIWGLDVWHSGEPAGEFPSIYRTVLGQTVPDQT